MAYQERFDELAKGLATGRVSRGQVLKGLAASLLLTGPLGALANPALAQVTDCASICKRLFLKSAKKRKKCTIGCNSLGCPDCGAQARLTITGGKIDLQPASSLGCATAKLCNAAHQDAVYKNLAGYLLGNGFKPAAFENELASGELYLSIDKYEDAQFMGHVLLSRFFKESTGEAAILQYTMDGIVGFGGETFAHAIVEKEDLSVAYSLFAGEGGKVEKLDMLPLLKLEANASSETASTVASSSTVTYPPTHKGNVTLNRLMELYGRAAGYVCHRCTTECDFYKDELTQYALEELPVIEKVHKITKFTVAVAWRWRKILTGQAPPNNCTEFCDQQVLLFSQYNEEHCGGCFNACGAVGAASMCCDGTCINPLTDVNNCGGCSSLDHNKLPAHEGQGMNCSKVEGFTCCGGGCHGECSEGERRNPDTCECESDGCAGGCPTGTNCCNGTCKSDSVFHCGPTCTVCPTAGCAHAACIDGVCWCR